jgi:hypothetical protein
MIVVQHRQVPACAEIAQTHGSINVSPISPIAAQWADVILLAYAEITTTILRVWHLMTRSMARRDHNIPM